MSQWGKSDNYSNSVLWGVTGFNGTPNTGVGSNRQNFYDNNTPNDYIPNLTVGQWGVDPTEIAVGNGPINLVTITFAGSGYNSNTLKTSISGGGGTGANVTITTASGRASSYTVVNGGSSYETNPTVSVLPPNILIFNGNTAVNVATSSISLTTANSYYLVDDYIRFAANATSSVGGLVDGTSYYVVASNTTAIKLSTTKGGTAIALTKASGDNTTAGGATFQGETATAVATVGGAQNKGVAHAGWVVRKVGAGGRAGRVQYETLVAMGSITGDGSDDTVLPDA